MLQVNTPGENYDLFFWKTKVHCDFCRAISVGDQSAGMLKGKTGTVLVQFADMHVLHQVETPAHRQKVWESCFRRQERQVGQRTCVNQIRLELSDNTFQFALSDRKVPGLQPLLKAHPFHVHNTRGSGEVPRIEAQDIAFMPAFGESRHKALVMNGIGTGQIKYAHSLIS